MNGLLQIFQASVIHLKLHLQVVKMSQLVGDTHILMGITILGWDASIQSLPHLHRAVSESQRLSVITWPCPLCVSVFLWDTPVLVDMLSAPSFCHDHICKDLLSNFIKHEILTCFRRLQFDSQVDNEKEAGRMMAANPGCSEIWGVEFRPGLLVRGSHS